jgi:hypothetical protein
MYANEDVQFLIADDSIDEAPSDEPETTSLRIQSRHLKPQIRTFKE